MMKKQYSKMNVILLNASFNFEKSEEKAQIFLNTSDEICISKILDDGFVVNVSRKLTFAPLNNTYVKVEFEVIVKTTETETIEEIQKTILEGDSSFGNVFSKASLMISQITSLSIFGPIITAPMYNPQSVVITTKV